MNEGNEKEERGHECRIYKWKDREVRIKSEITERERSKRMRYTYFSSSREAAQGQILKAGNKKAHQTPLQQKTTEREVRREINFRRSALTLYHLCTVIISLLLK